MTLIKNDLYRLKEDYSGAYWIKNLKTNEEITIAEYSKDYEEIKESIEILNDLPQLGSDSFFYSIRQILP